MTNETLRLFALGMVICSVGAVLGKSGEDTTLKEIASYRQWTRVTEKPTIVENSLAAGG